VIFLNDIFKRLMPPGQATALAARFAAQVKVEYPDLWPEKLSALN